MRTIRPISFKEQLFRCEQCLRLEDCERHRDYLKSVRDPDGLIFSCPKFDPIPCHTIGGARNVIAFETGLFLGCQECCHSVQTMYWPQPLCGAGQQAAVDGWCDQLALRADQLECYGLATDGEDY